MLNNMCRSPKLFGVFFVFLAVFCFAIPAQAATIRLSPPVGTFTVGGTFKISILLNTESERVNVINAEIQFPTDKLQVVPMAISGFSIIGAWLDQPVYDNQNGIIRLQGGIANGITTDSGLIAELTFRARGAGKALVRFMPSSRVLLADGKGTDTLKNVQNAVYILKLSPPLGPEVVSETHPDQTQWYGNPNVVLSWSNNNPVDGYSFVLNEIGRAHV